MRDFRLRASLFTVFLTGAMSSGCTLMPTVGPDGGGQQAAFDRRVVRTGDMAVTTEDPRQASSRTRQAVVGLGGYVERSSASRGSDVRMECRVPAQRLEDLMEEVSSLGDVEHRYVSSDDVTEAHADLESRLSSSIALRSRLQALLSRAGTVSEVLTVERELTRVQADIERMQSELDRMERESDMAALSVRLQEQRILGPVGLVFHAAGWVLSKLFWIR